jgi:hypothetical protein
MLNTRLTAVGEPETTEPAAPQPPPPPSPLLGLLILTLKTLSQRTLIALTACADLGMVASAFVLWWSVMEAPTVLQLVGVGMYGVFILAVLWRRHARG